jgi:hypothetical protein
MVNRRPQLEIVAPGTSPAEAAAVVAALERFMRETAPTLAPVAPPRNAWQRAALLEAVGHEDDGPEDDGPEDDGRGSWGDPHHWG